MPHANMHTRLLRPSARLLASVSHTNPNNLTSGGMSSSTTTAPSSASRRQSRLKKKKPPLGLDQFIQRQRVLSLWREIVRAVHKIPPSSTREELRSYARAEFERNKAVDDVAHIRYLISAGKTEFDTMRRYIDELTGR